MGTNGSLLVGKIVGTHGVKGTLKVYPYVESLDLFQPGASIRVREAGSGDKAYEIQSANPHKRVVLLSLKGVDSLDPAHALVGAELISDKADLPELGEGTYYWADLIGVSVFSIQGEFIGRIESIMQTGSNDVYVVQDPGCGKETLIPALESVVVKVDIQQKTMQVDLPEGL